MTLANMRQNGVRGLYVTCRQPGRSFRFGRGSASRCPHFVHRIRGPNDGTGTSSGQASTWTSV